MFYSPLHCNYKYSICIISQVEGERDLLLVILSSLCSCFNNILVLVSSAKSCALVVKENRLLKSMWVALRISEHISRRKSVTSREHNLHLSEWRNVSLVLEFSHHLDWKGDVFPLCFSILLLNVHWTDSTKYS